MIAGDDYCSHNNIIQLNNTHDNKIIISRIEDKQDNYGVFYYDKSLNKLCFEDNYNKITSLTSSTRKVKFNNLNDNIDFEKIIPILHGIDGKDGNTGIQGPPGKSFIFKGIWNFSDIYEVNDVIIDENDDDNLYICVNEPNNISPSNDELNWKFFWGNGLIFKGQWDSNKNYNKNNIVINGDNMYIAINKIDNSNNDINNKSWQIFVKMKTKIPEITKDLLDLKDNMRTIINKYLEIKQLPPNASNFKGNWKEDVKYHRDDIVVSDDNVYICTRNTITNPNVNVQNWKLLNNGTYAYTGEWSKSKIYTQNNLVISNQNLYFATCDINNTNNIIPNKSMGQWKSIIDNNYDNKIKFKGDWKPTLYTTNDIVKDNKDYDDIYICINKDTFKSTLPPSEDFNNWVHIFGNNFVYRGQWDANDIYKINHTIINPDDKSLYISKNNNESNFLPHEDNNKWELILQNNGNSNTNNTYSPITFFSLYTNSSCCIKQDDTSDLSYFDFDNCLNGHKSIDESNMYDFTVIKMEDNAKLYPIDCCMIKKTDLDYYEYNDIDKTILIYKDGFYKMTYNVVYHGSVYDVITKILIKNDNKWEELIHGTNKDYNRHLSDSRQDICYEKPDSIDDVFRCINHTFPFSVKNGQKEIKFLIKINDYNTNKKMFIHPLKTWINIEYVN